jgi:RND family efflux transporter MFP subunit
VDKRAALDALHRPAQPETRPEPRGGSGVGRLSQRIGAGVLGLLGLGAVLWWFALPPPVPVRTAAVTVEGGAAGAVLNATGVVMAQQQATVAAQTTAMVTEVYIREGETVKKGQIVARLDDRAARAAAAAAEGQMKAAVAQVEAAQALVERYESDMARKRALFAAGAASRASFEETEADLRQNRGLVAYYRGLVAQYRGNLAYYDIQRGYTVIRAPFAGVVTERYAHPGEMISPQAVGGFTQTGICTIVDMGSLEVDVDVGETFIQRIRSGQRASIVLDAYPDVRLPAHVIAIVPTANQQKATVKVRIGLDRADRRILPQMSAQVWFEADTAATGEADAVSLFVPKSAILTDASGTYVFRVVSDTVRKVPVRIAPARKDMMRVLSGLNETDRIVTSSPEPLEDGRKVRQP